MRYVKHFWLFTFWMCYASAPLNLCAQAPLAFSLVVLDTTHFADVDALVKALSRSMHAGVLVETRLSRGVVEFSGIFQGESDQLKAEVQSAMTERFSLESTGTQHDRYTLTLRKLPTLSP